MNVHRRQFFSLHDLLTMAALAALGGVLSTQVSVLGTAIHATGLSVVGGQPLAGLHVLAPILALGLVRKPGAATATSLLKGVVELLSGNPKGVIAILYCVAGGLGIDAAWLLCGGRHRAWVYMIAGGVGAATNVPVIRMIASLPSTRLLNDVLLVMAGVAFLSGAILAGLLGWWLLKALRRAGVASPTAETVPAGRRYLWSGAGAMGLLVLVLGATSYMSPPGGTPGGTITDEPPARATTPEANTPG